MRKPRRNLVWDERATALLVKHYPSTPMPELILLLGKTKIQIKTKCHWLGLRRDKSFTEKTWRESLKTGPNNHNWVEVGARRDTGRSIQLKLPSGEWVAEHRWVWEQANGPIPDGCYVSPLDGNRRNTDLANLKLVTKDEHCRRNQVRKYPAELQDVILAQQDLKRAVREKKS